MIDSPEHRIDRAARRTVRETVDRVRFRARARGGRGGAAGDPDPPPEGLLATGTIHNLGGSTMASGEPFTLGHLFIRGDVPENGSVKAKIGGSFVDVQMFLEAYWDRGTNADDTLRFSGIAGLLPAGINAGSSLDVELWSSADAPDRTAPASVASVISTLAGLDDYQLRVVLTSGSDNATWVASRNHALAGTPFNASTGFGSNPDRWYRVLSHGPMFTMIHWHTKLGVSGSLTNYHYQLRAEGIVTYHHASGLVQECIRVGQPNLFAGQGTHGISTWENKAPSSLSLYRGTKKIREHLSSDTYPPVIGRAVGSWWADEFAGWDWSDETQHRDNLFWEADFAYEMGVGRGRVAKVLPEFNLSSPDSAPTFADYIPAYHNAWPANLGMTGDGVTDGRIGPFSWYSIIAMARPSDLNTRLVERVQALALVPAFQILESTGMLPIKGNPSLSYGPLGSPQDKIGRTNLWTNTSPACQLRDEEYGSDWLHAYQEGAIEGTHWPKMHLTYAHSADVRQIITLQDQALSLVLNRGGNRGINFDQPFAPDDDVTGGAGAYVYAMRYEVGAVRGQGWARATYHLLAMLVPKYEYDYTNVRPESEYHKDRTTHEAAATIAQAQFYQANYPGEFPAVWGAETVAHGLNFPEGPDAEGRYWKYQAIYMNNFYMIGSLLASLSDDAGAADTNAVWVNGNEKLALHWWANSGVGCNYWPAGFYGMPLFYGASAGATDPANVITDTEELKQTLAEISNGGTYSCPAGLAEDGYAGGPPQVLQMLLGLASQCAIAGSTYNAATLYDTVDGLRSGSNAMKYDIKKAA